MLGRPDRPRRTGRGRPTTCRFPDRPQRVRDRRPRTRDVAGQPCPGVAQGAIQGGVARRRDDPSRPRRSDPAPTFRYRNKGELATIGRSSAVGVIGPVKLLGLDRLDGLVVGAHPVPDRLPQPLLGADRTGPGTTSRSSAAPASSPAPWRPRSCRPSSGPHADCRRAVAPGGSRQSSVCVRARRPGTGRAMWRPRRRRRLRPPVVVGEPVSPRALGQDDRRRLPVVDTDGADGGDRHDGGPITVGPSKGQRSIRVGAGDLQREVSRRSPRTPRVGAVAAPGCG